MRLKKLISFLIIAVGFYVLFYLKSGSFGCFGGNDKSFRNILISSLLIGIGLLIMKKNRTVK